MLSMWARIALRSATRSSCGCAVETWDVKVAKSVAPSMNEKREKPRILRVIDNLLMQCVPFMSTRDSTDKRQIIRFRQGEAKRFSHPTGSVSNTYLEFHNRTTYGTSLWNCRRRSGYRLKARSHGQPTTASEVYLERRNHQVLLVGLKRLKPAE